MGKKQKKVLILISGGIDSAACLKYYLDQNFDISTIFINYGQKARQYEFESAKKITDFYNVDLSEISVQLNKEFKSGEIIGRNAFLILSTIMFNPNFKGIISLGIHSGTPYYDCSESFLKTMNDLLTGYFNGSILLDAPFITWNKRMIINYCFDNDIPIGLTYSCEKGTYPPCGKCLSCLDRKEVNVGKKKTTKIR